MATTASPPALPARWSTFQRVKNTVAWVLIRSGFALMQRLPLAVARGMMLLLGDVVGRLPIPPVGQAARNLRRAFPELTRSQVRELGRASFRHLGECVAEATHLDEVLAENTEPLDHEAIEMWRSALAEGRGVIAVTGHIGNWELLAQALAREIPLSAVAKPTYDPRLTDWVAGLREARGLEIIWREKKGSALPILRALKRGRAVAFLIDQDTRVPGTFVPFFGHPAWTPAGPAQLALQTGAPVILGWSRRIKGRHRFFFERLPVDDLDKPGGEDPDASRALTARLTHRLETAIREQPEQWVWLHERWKTVAQPESEV